MGRIILVLKIVCAIHAKEKPSAIIKMILFQIYQLLRKTCKIITNPTKTWWTKMSPRLFECNFYNKKFLIQLGCREIFRVTWKRLVHVNCARNYLVEKISWLDTLTWYTFQMNRGRNIHTNIDFQNLPLHLI